MAPNYLHGFVISITLTISFSLSTLEIKKKKSNPPFRPSQISLFFLDDPTAFPKQSMELVVHCLMTLTTLAYRACISHVFKAPTAGGPFPHPSDLKGLQPWLLGS